MPRLSIIVPHCGDDSQLEMTLVSILETVPDESEIIVVHDGSYSDPYDLSNEVVFVVAEASCSNTALLNAALMASCAPYLNVVLPGVVVSTDWTYQSLQQFEDPSTACVAIPVSTDSGRHVGLLASTRATSARLQKGLVDQRRSVEPVAGPSIQCGFYRRKTLLVVGGWNEQLDLAAADVELAWILQTLGLNSADVEFDGVVDRSGRSRTQSRSIQQLAAISVAFGISASGIAAALGSFLLLTLTGKFATACAWSKGLLDRATVSSVSRRLQHAESELQAVSEEDELRSQPYESTMRRAA